MSDGRVVVEIDGDDSLFVKEIQSLSATAAKKLDGLGKSMQSTGDSLTRNVSVPLVAIGGMSFKVAADFEKSMNLVQAATKAPQSEMDALNDLAKQLGADTVFSAGEAAAAMLELAKAGMSPAQIQAGALASALDLAAAGGISLESAATITANAIAMFGLKAEDAASVADALAGGANASSASVDSLREALSQVGPGAKQAGLSLNDTVGVLSMFDAAGIKGSDAGTSLKVMLTRLVPATDEAAEAMKRYGLSFVDSKGNIDDITVVAGKLQAKLGKLSEAEKSRALNTIFGTDATRAASVLMQQGTKTTQQYIDATKDAAAAETMAGAAMKGSSGDIQEALGSLETAAISAGDAIAPAIVRISDVVVTLSNGFAELDPETQKTIVNIGLMALALGPAVKGVSLLASGIGSTIRFAKDASTAMQTFTKAEMAAGASATQANAALAGQAAAAFGAGMAIGGLINQIPIVQKAQEALGESIDKLTASTERDASSTDYMIEKYKEWGVEVDKNGNLTEAGRTKLDELAAAKARDIDATRNAAAAQRGWNDELVKTKDLQAGAERADIALQNAKLRLTDAQKAYTEAVANHGPKSREAIEANLNLRTAQLDLKDAQTKSLDAQNDLNAAIASIPKPKTADKDAWKAYYQAIGDKASYARDRIGEVNTLAALPVPAVFAYKWGNLLKAKPGGMLQIPKHGTGGYFDTSHIAVVGDKPEIIFPLGDAAFAAKYLPMLLASLPGGSSPGSAARMSGTSLPMLTSSQPRIINFNQPVRTYSETLRAMEDIERGLFA